MLTIFLIQRDLVAFLHFQTGVVLSGAKSEL